jgi:endonuclease/exonuclease/phosphatase family metal-dependent hydrolase
VVTFGIFQEKTSSDSVLVINTHFDHVSQVARENSIDLILSRFDKYIKAMPLIFMGDLNVSPDNKVYRKIMDSGTLTDSYYTIHPGKSIEGATFHGWNNDFSAGRIDYIFLSGKLDVKSSEVIHFRYKGEFPSDHLPVHSVLSIKK